MSSGGGTTVSTSEVAPWEAQRGYLEKGFADARGLYGAGAPKYYSAPSVASFDPSETAAQRATLGYATGPRPAAQQAAAENALIGSLGGQTGFDPTQTQNLLAGATDVRGGTPFSAAQMSDILAGNVRTGAGTPYTGMENALTQGVIDNLNSNILPGVREAQVRYQPGGGTRTDLETNKAIVRAVQGGLTKPLAEMYGGAYQQAQGMRQPLADQYAATYRDAQGRRLPTAELGIQQRQYGQQMYPSIMNAPLGMYNAMGGVGEQRRAMSQEGINQDMARYQYESNAGQNALRNYMAMVTGDYGSTTTSTTNSPKDYSALMGAAGTLGAGAMMAFSDISVKENIIPEGTKWKGLNVYNYNYIGDSTPRRGVMAQQVELTRPDAVTTINGVKCVNYGIL
jgi:hypothetical protein